MSRHDARIDFRGTLRNRHSALNLAAQLPRDGVVHTTAHRTPGAQVCAEFAGQHATRFDEE